MVDTGSDRVIDLARELPALIDRGNKLESMAFKHAHGSEERRRLDNAVAATWAEFHAVENHILALPCTTLAGAAVHVLLAYGINNSLAESATAHTALHDQAGKALRSALRVVAETAGLDLATVGGHYFAGDHTDPYPVVEVPAKDAA